MATELVSRRGILKGTAAAVSSILTLSVLERPGLPVSAAGSEVIWVPSPSLQSFTAQNLVGWEAVETEGCILKLETVKGETLAAVALKPGTNAIWRPAPRGTRILNVALDWWDDRPAQFKKGPLVSYSQPDLAMQQWQ
jgi:hypothetical protein